MGGRGGVCSGVSAALGAGLTAWAAWRRLAEGWEGRERLGWGSAWAWLASSAVPLLLESWQPRFWCQHRCRGQQLRGGLRLLLTLSLHLVPVVQWDGDGM